MIVVPAHILEAFELIRKGKTKAHTTGPIIEAALQWYLSQEGHGEEVDPLLDNRVAHIGRFLERRYKDGITPSPGGPDIVFWTDRDGRHPHFVHTPGAHFAGYKEDVLRDYVWKRIPGEQGERCVEYIRKCLDLGTVPPLELDLVTPAGVRFTETTQCHAVHENLVLSIIRNQVVVPQTIVKPDGRAYGSGA